MAEHANETSRTLSDPAHELGPSTDAALRPPIFILGAMPRTGTNFLWDLLRLHPQCARVPGMGEDYFLFHVRALTNYVEAVRRHWNVNTPVDTQPLVRLFGGAIVEFIAAQTPNRRALVKTPRVDNLDLFFEFFSNAQLLIIVRDGRAVVESGMKTFDWSFDWAARNWAKAIDTVIDFSGNRRSGARFLIVRYEDLYTTVEPEMRRILEFLQLDPDVYDFEKGAKLPVRGSSTLRKTTGGVHWQQIERDSGFNPLERWRHWSRWRHERFNWLAGRALAKMNYEVMQFQSGGTFFSLCNRLLDIKQHLASLMRPVFDSLLQWSTRRRLQRARDRQHKALERNKTCGAHTHINHLAHQQSQAKQDATP